LPAGRRKSPESPGGDMDQATIDEIQARLEEERASVERQLAEQGASPGGDVEVAVDEGFADSAQATMERSQQLALIEKLRDQHEEIVAALGRIPAGTYGRCERCGQQIDEERLEAIPTSRLCVSCKQSVGAR
jgi:DnaK suppressor protein